MLPLMDFLYYCNIHTTERLNAKEKRGERKNKEEDRFWEYDKQTQ